jgi:4-methyl-5(b-hydroxyethyl)-thiazole monophosphate biosynthesis
MSKVVVTLASGFEEIEAISIIDVLRRAGCNVIIAGVDGITLIGANGISVNADVLIDTIDANDIDMVILPGGWGGTNILATNEKVQQLLKDMDNLNKNIGAICAAPYALKSAGVLKQNYTCYPSVEEKINQDGYNPNKKVVIDGNIITSRGPGTSICFAIEIAKILKGEDTYNALKNGLLADYCV